MLCHWVVITCSKFCPNMALIDYYDFWMPLYIMANDKVDHYL